MMEAYLPNYTFKNLNTGEEFTVSMTMADRETYLTQNPHLEQLIVSAPAFSSRAAMGKPDDSFRDVLRSIKRRNPRSNINTF